MQIDKVEIAKKLVESGAIEIREEPFIYSSGNRGPGYIMIKGLVGQPKLVEYLISLLAQKVNNIIGDNIDFVDGNATGGMIYGWELCKKLSEIQKRNIPYVYLRGSRKEGGHNELITGDLNNPDIEKGMRCLVTEELVNYGTTTNNAVNTFRKCGYECNYAACVLDYSHQHTMDKLGENNITLISLISLKEILDICEEHQLFPQHLITSYRDYLDDSITWQIERGYTIPEEMVAKAREKGYKMIKLDSIDAIDNGSPESKVKEGVIYWKCVEHKFKKLYIALDYDNQNDILINANMFADHPSDKYGFKINLDSLLYFSTGAANPYIFIEQMKILNKSIFVDLKMWNGFRTMSNIIRSCCELGVDIINVYGHIGKQFLEELCAITKEYDTKLFVVTVLTHYDDEYCMKIYGQSMDTVIRKLSELAVDCCADGIILPPTKLGIVSDLNIEKLCPAIRIDSLDTNYQKQISTPESAVAHGADYIVIGSSITKAQNPLETLDDILKKID